MTAIRSRWSTVARSSANEHGDVYVRASVFERADLDADGHRSMVAQGRLHPSLLTCTHGAEGVYMAEVVSSFPLHVSHLCCP